MKDLSLFFQPERRTIVLIIMVFVLVFGSILSIFLWMTPGQSASSPKGTTSLSSSPGPSPLLFGTNLLLDQQGQMLSSQDTQTMLSQAHVHIVRFPASTASVPEAQMVSTAKIVKQVGAVPVVVLPATTSKDASSRATTMIKDMNQVFGQTSVYYEYGNEDDIAGTTAAQYTAAWNAQVPTLKHLASNGKFLGPVTYQYNQSYLATFLHQAQPRPDGVSWHEYTCDASEANTVCLAHITNWSQHIKSARSTMNDELKTTVPIMITEWNYAPNATAQDKKSTDPSFMNTWTTQAMQTLAQNQVYASMQYALMGTSTALVTTNKSMTPQGKAFQQLYGSMVIARQAPTPTATSASESNTVATAVPDTTPQATIEPTATAIPDTTPQATIEPTTTPIPDPTPQATVRPTATPIPDPTPQATIEPTATPIPDPTPQATVRPTATAIPDTTPQATVRPTATAIPDTTPQATVGPTATAIPDTTPQATVEPTATTMPITQPDPTPVLALPNTASLLNCTFNNNPAPGGTSNNLFAVHSTSTGWQCYAGPGSLSISQTNVDQFCTGAYTGSIKYAHNTTNFAVINGSQTHTCYSSNQLLGETITVNQLAINVLQNPTAPPTPGGPMASHVCTDKYPAGDARNQYFAIFSNNAGNASWLCFSAKGGMKVDITNVTKFCTGNNRAQLYNYNGNGAALEVDGGTKFTCYTISNLTGQGSTTLNYISIY